MTPAVDDEIFRLPIPNQRSDDQWEAIARHLTDELGAHLRARLSVDDRLVVDGVALRCETSGPAADGRDPFLSYHGIIGFENIADAPHVDAVDVPLLPGPQTDARGSTFVLPQPDLPPRRSRRSRSVAA